MKTKIKDAHGEFKTKIKDAHGELKTNSESITKVFVDYYKDILGDTTSSRVKANTLTNEHQWKSSHIQGCEDCMFGTGKNEKVVDFFTGMANNFINHFY